MSYRKNSNMLETNLNKKGIMRFNLNSPEKFVDSPFSQIILNPKNKVWDAKFISRHNAWNIVNYLSYLEMQSPDITWEGKLNFTSKNVFLVMSK